MLWSSKREGQKDKVSTNAYKERSIALTLPSYTPSSIARITSGAILHGQNDTIGGRGVRVRGGKEREGEREERRRGGREKGREKEGREKAQQKEVPTKGGRKRGKEKRRKGEEEGEGSPERSPNEGIGWSS